MVIGTSIPAALTLDENPAPTFRLVLKRLGWSTLALLIAAGMQFLPETTFAGATSAVLILVIWSQMYRFLEERMANDWQMARLLTLVDDTQDLANRRARQLIVATAGCWVLGGRTSTELRENLVATLQATTGASLQDAEAFVERCWLDVDVRDAFLATGKVPPRAGVEVLH